MPDVRLRTSDFGLRTMDFGLQTSDLGSPLSYALSAWSRVFSAPPAENGTPPPSTNPPAAGRVTWKTARSAVSPTSCAWSTTRRRRSFSSRRNWSDKPDEGLRTSDLGPQTCDLDFHTWETRRSSRSDVRGLTSIRAYLVESS